MKKRIFMLALVVGILLSFSASAWATAASVSSIAADPSTFTLKAKETASTTITFTPASSAASGTTVTPSALTGTGATAGITGAWDKTSYALTSKGGAVTGTLTLTMPDEIDAGNYTITVKTGSGSGKVDLTITVPEAVALDDAPKPEFKTKSITGLKAGTPLGDGKEIELTKDESVLGTVTWAITESEATKLASYGLEFSPDSHALTGTPTASGTFSFTVTASNVNGDTPQSTSQAISVTITGTKPTFLSWMPADKANMGKITSSTSQGTKDMIGPFFMNGVLVKDRAIAPYPAEVVDDPENPSNSVSLPRRNGADGDTQQFILAVQGTLPITVSVSGLPAGLTATQADDAGKTAIEAGATQTVEPDLAEGEEYAGYNGGNGTAWVVITGTPTKAGISKSVKITAKNADGEVSRTYTMEVLAKPTLKTTSVKATWGKELKTTLKADGGTKDHPITWALASGDLPDGIELDEKTGELKGTYKWNDGGDVFGEGEKTHTFSVWIVPENDAGPAEEWLDGDSITTEHLTAKTKVDIVMSLAKPVIENKKAKVTYGDKTAIALSSLPKMKLEDGAITPIFLVVSGGGALTWTSGDLPAGLSVAMADGYSGTTEDVDNTGNESLPRRNGAEGDTALPQEVDSSIVIYGTPTDTAKNQSVKFQVANAAGNDSVTLKFNIEATEISFTSELPHKTTNYTVSDAGDAVGKEYTDTNMVQLVATPGPITWSAKNLPAGIKLSDDKSDTTKAYLVGTLTKATKFDKNGQNVVTVTATNKNITDKKKGSVTISSDWRVFEAPVITTTKFSDLTTGKKYTGKVAVKNAGADNIFVYIHENETPTADQLSTPLAWGDKFDLDGKSNYNLQWSSDIMAIVGSLDRMPDGGQLYVSIWARNAAGAAETVTLPLKVKGQAPKLTTTKIKAFTSGSEELTFASVDASGTQPITLRAYIDNKTAKAFGWLPSDAESTASIDLTGTADVSDNSIAVTAGEGNTTGFVFVPTVNTVGTTTGEEGTGKGRLYFIGTERTIGETTLPRRGSFKGLPITFVAYNAASTKPTTKAIKVDVNGGLDPVIMFTPQVAATDETTGVVAYSVGDMIVMSKDVTVYATEGALEPMTFQVSGDTPVTISAKGDKNGVTSTVSETDATTITIQGASIPTTKETKTVITITALNPSTKKKVARKLTVIQPLAPIITTAEKGLTKEVELGKKFSLKVAAKGSKTIKWSIVDPAEGAANPTNTKADLIALGLSLDQKGAITGTPTGTTSVDVDGDGVPTYKPMTFTVKAENAGGSATTVVTVGVKGKKPKLLTKTLTISRDAPDLTAASARILTNIETTDTKSFVTFSFESESGVNGLTFATPNAEERNIGRLTGTPEAATKGTSAKIKIENLGTEVKGSLKLIIRDPAPEIEGNADLSVSASATEKASAETTLTVAEPSDGAKIAWKITKKPTAKGVTLKLKGDGASATLTVTVPKKFAQTVSDTFTISATNGSSKLSGTIDGTISVTPAPEETDESALPDDESATPEGEETAEETESETEAEETAETETESEETATEGEITLGTARTEAQLTDGQRAMLEKGGYVIAAILPEITVTADGQYDIDNIELNENAPEGAELVWFAFPSEATTDDDIVDFYDEAGAEIKGVPASRKIVASPWLNEGVTYTPVIAVKAKNAGGARDTLEGAEEGSVVTQEALETAAAPAE